MAVLKDHFRNAHFLSIPQQKIMLLASLKGMRINYKEQEIYKVERSFRKAMDELEAQRIMIREKINGYYDGYVLTANGVFYVKHVILS